MTASLLPLGGKWAPPLAEPRTGSTTCVARSGMPGVGVLVPTSTQHPPYVMRLLLESRGVLLCSPALLPPHCLYSLPFYPSLCACTALCFVDMLLVSELDYAAAVGFSAAAGGRLSAVIQPAAAGTSIPPACGQA